jgi:hypothetical protein
MKNVANADSRENSGSSIFATLLQVPGLIRLALDSSSMVAAPGTLLRFRSAALADS